MYSHVYAIIGHVDGEGIRDGWYSFTIGLFPEALLVYQKGRICQDGRSESLHILTSWISAASVHIRHGFGILSTFRVEVSLKPF